VLKNSLFYGDNLDVMKSKIDDESVDLIYLDPPFKSDINYNMLFTADGLHPDEAQMTAFKDTWAWDHAAQETFDHIQDVPDPNLVGLVNALHSSLSTSPMMAYLVNMAIRLVEMRKKLKPTGSLYLHCDPTASHYLKTIMDSIFGAKNFRNEIVWRRTGSHNSAKRFGPIHDVILFYTKSDTYTWNPLKRPYMKGHVEKAFVKDGNVYRTNYSGNVLSGSGRRGGESGKPWRGFDPDAKNRHWAIPSTILEEIEDDISQMGTLEKLEYLYENGFITIKEGDEWPRYQHEIKSGAGQRMSDMWAYQPYTEDTVFGSKDGVDADVRWMGTKDRERLGYQTQKPLGLMRRIIRSSSNKGDVVMDPFCGCGTTIEAAEELQRKWIGVDISPFAIQLILKVRLGGAFPKLQQGKDFEVDGLPTTLAGAEMLSAQDKKAFEVWAVAMLDGIPNEKKGADKGIDGHIPFRGDEKKKKYAIVSVKSGKLKADDIRSLVAVAKRESAKSMGFGVFVSFQELTKGMKTDAAAAGSEIIHGQSYPLIQHFTIEDILKGKRARLPLYDTAAAYKKAGESSEQEGLFGED